MMVRVVLLNLLYDLLDRGLMLNLDTGVYTCAGDLHLV